MSSFSKKMVKNVFNDEVFNLVFVYFFFSVVCECVESDRKGFFGGKECFIGAGDSVIRERIGLYFSV